RNVDRNASPVNQLDPVQDEPNQAVGHRFAEVTSIPLKQIPLRGKLLGFGVRWVIANHRDFAVVLRLDQTSYLLELCTCGADVIFQPHVIVLSTFWKKALLDDDVGNQLVCRWVALR